MGTGELGVVAGLATAIPIVGPTLVAGCLSCVGVGAPRRRRLELRTPAT